MTNGGKRGKTTAGTSQAICMTAPVDVEGKQAVWVFTEFETEEPLDTLREWLIPQHWPDWGGAMFKEMRQIGPADVRPLHSNAQHTGAKFLEVVEIGGHRLETELHCEIKSAKNWAAMSYDLDRSIGDVLQVDRGYLMAADVGGARHVKALKIVGFTNTPLNTVVSSVCPGWGEGVQSAVSKEAKRLAGGRDPKPGSVGDSDPRDPTQAEQEQTAAFTGGMAEQWISCVTGSANFYAPYAADVTERMMSGKYGQQDLANDTTRLFQRLAKDWSRVWQTGVDNMASWAQVTVRPTAGTDPAASGRTVEHTTLMVEARSPKAHVSISDLQRISDSPATIRASDVEISPAALEDAGSAYVTIEVETTNVPAGLYEGALMAGSDSKQAPALFYVSHAQSPTAGE